MTKIYDLSLSSLEESIIVFNCCTGEDLAERGAQETSSVVVETVHKVSKSRAAGPVIPIFKSDASKVTSKGMGLKKAFLAKQNMFTVHAGDAGIVFIFNRFSLIYLCFCFSHSLHYFICAHQLLPLNVEFCDTNFGLVKDFK